MFTGTSIGANDFIKYETGKETLNSRSEYCSYISNNNLKSADGFGSNQFLLENERSISEEDLLDFSKVWNLKKNLAAYRAKRIAFISLPTPLLKAIAAQQLTLTNEKMQLTKNIAAIENKLKDEHSQSVVNREPNAYTAWQIKEEWPLQLKLLGERLRLIDDRLQNLAEKRFTDSELFELMNGLSSPTKQSLLIEVKHEKSLFSPTVSFYPIWKQGDELIPASESPWFRVQQGFLPKSSQLALLQKSTPETVREYLKLATLAYGSDESLPKAHLAYEQQKILIFGSPKSSFLADDTSFTFTSPNDLVIEGLLDLACLHTP